MTPCQEFRVWARRAPASERVGGALAAFIVVALVSWLLVPGGKKGATKLAAAQGPTTGPTASATAGGSSTTIGPTGTPSTLASGGSGAAGAGLPGGVVPAGGGTTTDNGIGTGGTTSAAGCVSPPGTAAGVTASQIKIAITLTNIVGPAANSIFGVATPAQQRVWYDSVIAAINAGGGIACRKVVAQYYDANPADQSDLQQKCLDIAQAGVFAEIDNGSYANYPQKQCFAQHQIPYFGSYFLSQAEKDKFYPYLFNLVTYDTLERNTILGLQQRGFFGASGGFKKLGFIYQDCDKALVNVATTAIQQAGVAPSQLVTFDVGCPSVFSSPATLEQAVLKFAQNGVTHVTFSHFVGDIANFTNIAEQQSFRPKYGMPDEDLIDISYGSQQPNHKNIANALVITSGRSGEERTPGATPSAATSKCDAILQSHGLPPTYRLPAGAGYTCDQLWMFQAAVNNASTLQASALAAGLQRAKSVDFSYPAGQNDFSGTHATTGGQFWRVGQFMPSCSCWQVVDATFHPSFQ